MNGDIIDLYRGEVGAFTVPPDGAVLPFEPPFVPPPLSVADAFEQIASAFAHFAEGVSQTVTQVFGTHTFGRESAPPANRAARRRKHAPPERPGWMAAFPPLDPARTARRR